MKYLLRAIRQRLCNHKFVLEGYIDTRHKEAAYRCIKCGFCKVEIKE